MAAAVALVEPQMAAKPAQAAMVAITSPPLIWPKIRWLESYSLRLMPVAKASDPIKMNIGITVSE